MTWYIFVKHFLLNKFLGMCQPGSNKPADTPSGTGPSQAQVHMDDDNLFDLKPNVPVRYF